MKRNRQQTTQNLLQSAKDFLVKFGFQGWGVNEVARFSGYDKVLIYRYFEDLDGLLQATLKGTAFWPDIPGDNSNPALILEMTYRYFLEDPFRWKALTTMSEFPKASNLNDIFLRQRDQWCRQFADFVQGPRKTEFTLLFADSIFFQAHFASESRFQNPWASLPHSLEVTRSPAIEEDELPIELL